MVAPAPAVKGLNIQLVTPQLDTFLPRFMSRAQNRELAPQRVLIRRPIQEVANRAIKLTVVSSSLLLFTPELVGLPTLAAFKAGVLLDSNMTIGPWIVLLVIAALAMEANLLNVNPRLPRTQALFIIRPSVVAGPEAAFLPIISLPRSTHLDTLLLAQPKKWLPALEAAQ